MCVCWCAFSFIYSVNSCNIFVLLHLVFVWLCFCFYGQRPRGAPCRMRKNHGRAPTRLLSPFNECICVLRVLVNMYVEFPHRYLSIGLHLYSGIKPDFYALRQLSKAQVCCAHCCVWHKAYAAIWCWWVGGAICIITR